MLEGSVKHHLCNYRGPSEVSDEHGEARRGEAKRNEEKRSEAKRGEANKPFKEGKLSRFDVGGLVFAWIIVVSLLLS